VDVIQDDHFIASGSIEGRPASEGEGERAQSSELEEPTAGKGVAHGARGGVVASMVSCASEGNPIGVIIGVRELAGKNFAKVVTRYIMEI
jgi:hypothetical protein